MVFFIWLIVLFEVFLSFRFLFLEEMSRGDENYWRLLVFMWSGFRFSFELIEFWIFFEEIFNFKN